MFLWDWECGRVALVRINAFLLEKRVKFDSTRRGVILLGNEKFFNVV